MQEQNQNQGLSSSQSLVPASQAAVENKFAGDVTHQRAEMAAVQVAKEAEAQVQARFVMAIKNPRDEEQARTKIARTCKNLMFAEKAIYKKPVGKSTIEGPSIRFAEEMARNWKNMYINSSVIYEDELRRLVRVMILDLESNLDYDKTITIEKTVERKNAKGRDVVGERINSYNERVFIVKATDDELMNKENALASKAIRNGVLRCIPEHIIEQAMGQARATIREGVNKDPDAAKRKIVDYFANVGIMPKDLEDYLGHKLEQITPAELVDLQNTYNTLKDGQATWKEILESRDAEIVSEKKEPDTGTIEKNMEAGKPEDHKPVDAPIQAPEQGSDEDPLEVERTEVKSLWRRAFKEKRAAEDWLHSKFQTVKIEELSPKQLDKTKSLLLDMIDN